MKPIIVLKNNYNYDPETQVIHIPETETPRFATEYEVINHKSGKSATFEFTHSTGSEWDPNTEWVYKAKDLNIFLHVKNDEILTKKRANDYLAHKLQP